MPFAFLPSLAAVKQTSSAMSTSAQQCPPPPSLRTSISSNRVRTCATIRLPPTPATLMPSAAATTTTGSSRRTLTKAHSTTTDVTVVSPSGLLPPPGVKRFTMVSRDGVSYVIDVPDAVLSNSSMNADLLQRRPDKLPVTVYRRSPSPSPLGSPTSRRRRSSAVPTQQHHHQQQPSTSATCAPPSDEEERTAAEDSGRRLVAMETTADKLRYILHQLNRGEMPLEDLKRNIEYAALVLETAYMDETRRICDEDDDLAEVTPEAVPDEVREWLAATFTRQAAAQRGKPKFKSVANAIRTGIFFEKLFKRSHGAIAPIPLDLQPVLTKSSQWDFDPFFLNQASEGHALKYMGFELFNKHGFLERFRIPYQYLEKYLLALEAGYSKHNNPYHNIVHATDVVQTSNWMLTQTGLANCLSDLEIFAVIFSALIHDYEHTGHTNNFHVQSGSEFALLYNDRSVLENHHVSSCFRLMQDPDMNLLAAFSKEEYREFRNLSVEIVLATDMSTHFVQIKTMKNMLTLPEGIDKTKAMCLIVHACDISHPAKPFYLHEMWTNNVLEEFFRQGDIEASMGLPYSPLCDRASTHVAESQIGFIDFIVEPTLVVCGEMLAKMVEPLVSMPPNDLLSVTGGDTSVVDGDSGGNSSMAVSPLPQDLSNRRGSSPSEIRRLPMTEAGKLEIPTPWIKVLHDNKAEWKVRSAADDAERKKKAIAENGTK